VLFGSGDDERVGNDGGAVAGILGPILVVAHRG
jgi:hypothetical protein